MKTVLIQIWSEVDPTLNLKVDGGSVLTQSEKGDRLFRVNPLAKYAVKLTQGLADTRTVVFSIGTGHRQALQAGLALGATEAIEISIGDIETNMHSIRRLADFLDSLNPIIAITYTWGGIAASMLDWAYLSDADRLCLKEDSLTAVRHLGKGAGETVEARLPVIVSLHLGLAGLAPYVSVDRLNAVADRQINTLDLKDNAAPTNPDSPGEALQATPLQIARPRTKLGQAEKPTATMSGQARMAALMGGAVPMGAPTTSTSESAASSPEEMADEFVRYLARHGFLHSHNHQEEQ